MEFFALLTLLAFFVIGGLCFIVYVVALVNAAKTEKWLWFVLMLLFGPIFLSYFRIRARRRSH